MAKSKGYVKVGSSKDLNINDSKSAVKTIEQIFIVEPTEQRNTISTKNLKWVWFMAVVTLINTVGLWMLFKFT